MPSPSRASESDTWAWFAGEAVAAMLCGKPAPTADQIDRAAKDAAAVADKLVQQWRQRHKEKP